MSYYYIRFSGKAIVTFESTIKYLNNMLSQFFIIDEVEAQRALK